MIRLSIIQMNLPQRVMKTSHKLSGNSGLISTNSPNTSRVQVGVECRRRRLPCSHRDVAVGPYEIEAVSVKTGAVHRGQPLKFMEREVTLCAKSANLR